MSATDRRAMLAGGHGRLSVRRQCALLGLSRSAVYRPMPEHGVDELALMRRIDAVFLAQPFYGSRRIAATLSAGGETVNRKRVQRLMRAMGIAALGPKPRTSKPAPGHKIYPYLLRDIRIERANQVVRRHHLHPDAAGIPVSGGGDGLVEPCGAVVAAIEHDGGRVLRGRAGGRPAATRPA